MEWAQEIDAQLKDQHADNEWCQWMMEQAWGAEWNNPACMSNALTVLHWFSFASNPIPYLFLIWPKFIGMCSNLNNIC